MRFLGLIFVLVLASCVEGEGTRRVVGSGGGGAPDQTVAAADAVLSAPIGTVSRSASRTALVIGNSGYSSIPSLANPASDARLMAKTLSSLGFRIEGGGAQLDLTRGQMTSALAGYRRRLASRGGIGVVYFAGHAVQISGRNWLAPTDVAPHSAGDVARQFVPAEALFGPETGGGGTVNLVILDACRDNPFQASAGTRSSPIEGLRSSSAGLSRLVAPPDTLVAFATAPGSVALDGAGSNSPYAIALSRALTEPGARIEDVFIRTRNIVERATRGVQTPWETSSLTQRVVLNEGASSQALTSAFDGIYAGSMHCQSLPGDWGIPDWASEPGRGIRFSISNGHGTYRYGPNNPAARWNGGQFYENWDIRISESGKVKAPGRHQYTPDPNRPEPLYFHETMFAGSAGVNGMKLRGYRGPRSCRIVLERY